MEKRDFWKELAAASPIRLSVAAPAYNEEEGLSSVVENWLTYLRQAPDVAQFEIVVCNDGSRDNTGAVLDVLATSHPEVRSVHFTVNQGAAAALTAAIAATRNDWVLLLDSDGQFPIENLQALLSALRANRVAAALGIRQKKDSAFARFGTWSSGIVCNILYGTKIQDFNSACKLVWGPLLRALPLEAKGMNYSTEVTARLLERGIVPACVPIEHRPRVTGSSSMRLVRGAIHRFLFVTYMAYRRLLLKRGILRTVE